MARRAALMLVAVLSVLGLASGPASADKLVVFKNGKAMKVRQVTPDGKWVKCEFEDKNFLSVPASRIQSIEDVAAGSSAGELKPTQVAAGSAGSAFNPGPAGIGAGGLPPEVPPTPDESVAAQEQGELQQAIAEERANRQANPQQGVGANAGFGRRGMRVGGQPNVNPFQPGGLQPLNQPGSIFQNRSLTQRNNNLRSNNQNGPIRPTGTNTQNQDN